MKTRLLFVAVVIILFALVAYFLTFGHFFLPLPSSAHYANQKVETRFYYPFVIPYKITVAWRIKYPGRVRLIEAAESIPSTRDNQKMKLVLEKLGSCCLNCAIISIGLSRTISSEAETWNPHRSRRK